MRLWTAVALLLSTSPLMASDELPAKAKYGIEALVASRYITEKCPTYRIDQMALVGIMVSTELTADDVTGRYSAAMKDIDDRARLHEGASDQQFCDFLFNFYQGEGKEQHLIERK